MNIIVGIVAIALMLYVIWVAWFVVIWMFSETFSTDELVDAIFFGQLERPGKHARDLEAEQDYEEWLSDFRG